MTPDDDEVVILNDYATVSGGSTSVAIASAVGLAAAGRKVTFFSCVGPVAPALLSRPNLEVVCLDQPELVRDPSRARAFFTGLRNGRAVAALRRVLGRKDARRTVVHAHTWTKALSPYALDAAAAMGFPLVVTLHDFAIACPTAGFFVHRQDRICHHRPLSAGCLLCRCDRRNQAHKWWRSLRMFLQNRVLRLPSRVTHYVGVSAFSANLLRPHLPAAKPVTVVRNPVECPDDGPAPVADNRVFLFLGRLVREKGVRLLAAAARDTGLPVVFAGEGALEPELRRRCPAARFTGWLDGPALREELRRARALVFPSLWYETLGLVVIEAAAAGVPVIVSDSCAAIDQVRPGRTGLYFQHGSANSLATAMRRLALSDPLAARLGREAYRWYWSDPWTVETHVAQLGAVYRACRSAGAPNGEPRHECLVGHGAR